MSTQPQIIEEVKLPNGLTQFTIDWPKRDSRMIQTTRLTRTEVEEQIALQLERETKIKQVLDKAHKRVNRDYSRAKPKTRKTPTYKICLECDKEIFDRTKGAKRHYQCEEIAKRRRQTAYRQRYVARKKQERENEESMSA